MPRIFSADFHSSLVLHRRKPIKCTFNTLLGLTNIAHFMVVIAQIMPLVGQTGCTIYTATYAISGVPRKCVLWTHLCKRGLRSSLL